jgi:gliding motility-associated-like protein
MRIEPYFPIPDFTVDRDSGCAPHFVQFTNTSQYTTSYIWYFGDGGTSTDSEPSHTYVNGGIYSVTLFVSGPGGERQILKQDYIKVLFKPFTSFSLAPNIGFLPDARFITRNETTGATSYAWNWTNPLLNPVGSSNDFEPLIYINDSGYFTVQLISTNAEGCKDTLTKQNALYVNPKGVIYIPNTFTPNRDNLNDGFIPRFTSIDSSDYAFEIFNRWGERVFYTNDPTQVWNGTFAGDICQQGIYAWRLSTRFYSGDPINKEGVVHLLR